MTLFKSQKVKIDSKDMDSYLKRLWWLTKRSMTIFKSQKVIKDDIVKKCPGSLY